jgi:hypothetical protein
MRILLVSIYVLLNHLIFSQGLNYEKGLLPKAVVSNQIVRTKNSETYLAYAGSSSLSSKYIYVSKIDTNGNQIWEINASTSGYPDCSPINLEINSDGSFYLLSYNMLFCYPISDFKWVLQKFDATGNQLWIREWDSPSWSYSQFQGLTIHQDETIGLNFFNLNNTSGILRLNNLGLTTDIINVQTPLTYLNGYLTNGHFVAADAQTVSLFDNQGNFLNSYNLPNDIRELKVYNDSIYILTLDKIYLLSSGLNLLATSTFTGYNGLTRLKVNAFEVSCLAENTGNIFVLKLQHNLSNLQVQSISCSHNTGNAMDFEQNGYVTIAETKYLFENYALRLRDYSLNSGNSVTINHSDVGLTDINITNVQVLAGPNSQYVVKIWCDVVLKNFGTTTVQNCKILHAYGAPLNYACGENYYDNLFTNLNLAPGQSITLNLGLIHDKTEYLPGQQQALNYNLCVYTAIPNELVDMTNSNDFICESVFLGYGATEDLTSDNIQVQPNPSNGNFEIKSEQSLGVIAIYDLAGKKILSFETTDNSCLIDLSTYPRGAYHMNITNKNESYHKQILVVE